MTILKKPLKNVRFERKRKRNKDDQEDLSYISKLSLDDKSSTTPSSLEPGESSKKSGKKKGVSPAGSSPRFNKDSSMNDSLKKGKPKAALKKKKKTSKE